MRCLFALQKPAVNAGGIFTDSDGAQQNGYKRTLVLMTFTAMMVMFIDIMLVPAMQFITRDFSNYADWVSWILSIYLLVGAVANPIVGKLADLYGKRRMLLITLALYTVGLIGCALMHSSFIWFIFFRAMQGVGLAMFPLFYGIIRDTFPPQMVPMSIGIVSAMFSIGVSIGLLGGGWIVANYGWKYCYYIMAPLFVVLLGAFYLWVRDAGVFGGRRTIDFPGAAVMSLCILAILIAMTLSESHGFSDLLVIGCLVIFAVTFLLLVLWERRAKEPLVKLSLLTGSGRGAHVTAFLFGLAMFMLYQTLPYLLAAPAQYGGFAMGSTFDIGLTMFPMAVIGLLISPFVGKWCRKKGRSAVILALGMFFFGLGDLMLVFLHSELWMIVVALCLAGVGNAMTMIAMINVVVETSPAEDFGIASGMNTMFRLIGGSVGPVLGTMILANFVAASFYGVKYYGIEGYVWTWAVGALLCFIGAVSAYLLKPKKTAA